MAFFGNRRLIIVLVGLVLLITVMGYTSRERSTLTGPEKFIKDTFSVVQGFFYRPAQAVASFFREVGRAYDVYNENRVLKANLDQYASVAAQLRMMEAENERLRTLLDVKNRLHDYKLRVAEVVARSSDHWNEVLVIDKGSKHGIKKDMAVLSPTGFIGRVQSVANFSATVELITAVENSNHISAFVLAETSSNGKKLVQEVPGIIEEYDAQKKWLIMKKVPLGTKIAPKQHVVTSGLGGIIPKGLYIGQVVSVTTDEYGLTQTVYVKPSADLAQLNEVLVVERPLVLSPSGELVPSKTAGDISSEGPSPSITTGTGEGSE